MTSPVVVAAIGIAAASLFGALGRQFRAYANGQRSDVSRLQGNVWLTAAFILIICTGTSAVLTFLVDGSEAVFWSILAAFAVFVAAIFCWSLARKRNGL